MIRLIRLRCLMRLILTRGPPDFGADAAGLGALASFCPLPSANGPVRRIHQVHRDYALTAFIGREFVTDKYRSMATRSTVTSLSDDALLAHVGNLAARERQVPVDLIAALDEVDARRLYLGAGYSSLFMYCTQALHLSEQAAYDRIAAARCGRRYP